MMWFGEENAGVRVAWEAYGQQAFARCERTSTDALGNIGWRSRKALAQRRGIQRSDGKYSDAALVTFGMARKMRTGTLGCGRKCRIDDGEEFVHTLRKSVSGNGE